MDYFCNLSALLAIDRVSAACFSALSPEVRRQVCARSALLHTREELLLCICRALLPQPE